MLERGIYFRGTFEEEEKFKRELVVLVWGVFLGLEPLFPLNCQFSGRIQGRTSVSRESDAAKAGPKTALLLGEVDREREIERGRKGEGGVGRERRRHGQRERGGVLLLIIRERERNWCVQVTMISAERGLWTLNHVPCDFLR